MSPENETRLRRKAAAEFLLENGYPVAPATLAKYASVGGGPEFEKFGRLPLYRPSRLLHWAESKSTGPHRSTSDKGAANAAG